LDESARGGASSHDQKDKPPWLLWDFWTAIGTLLLGGATLALVAKTDRLIKSAEEGSRRQLRAYVAVENSTLNGLDEDETPTALVNFRNVGQTPALDLTCRSRMVIAPYPLGDYVLDLGDDSDLKSLEPLGPTIMRSKLDAGFPASMSALQMAGLGAGEWALYVFGEITYQDVFGTPHITRYCRFAGGAYGLDKGLAAYHEANDMD
jgi:hypothetical protein